MESPCKKCELHQQGIKKDSQECVECEKRIEYVRWAAKQETTRVNTIITQDRVCRDCNKKFPFTTEYYSRHHISGWLTICKKCQGKRIKNGYKSGPPKKPLEQHKRIFVKLTDDILKVYRVTFECPAGEYRDIIEAILRNAKVIEEEVALGEK